jgi:BASS family bile acid:Na+ symporter
MNKTSGVALIILLVTGVGVNASNIVDLVGSGGFAALILFVVGSLAIGSVMGGRDRGARSVLGLGTAQRNVAAAILVASINFPGTMTLPFVLVASIVLPLILLPTARRMGRRAAPVSAAAPAGPPVDEA